MRRCPDRDRGGNGAKKRRAHTPQLTALLAALALPFGGCSGLPALDARVASNALTDTEDTRLGKAVRADAAANPDKSGIYPLERPLDAFAARALLARAADRSLDVQYYIWHGDTTGYLLFEELWNAAERGVRVRLLLDDNGISGLDQGLAALDSHPNIQVRLFNPFVNRRFRVLGYLTDFRRLNRRMHNKSFTADTQATIVGGRNVGDEYFGAGRQMIFADIDVLAVGRIAGEVAAAFDAYWNSDSAYPAQSIVGKAAPEEVANLKAEFSAVRTSPDAVEYIHALWSTRFVEGLLARNLPLEWAPVQLVYDEPTKALGKAKVTDLLLSRMKQAIGEAKREIDLISPYFVPGREGTRTLSAILESGIRLRILTNSLAATDVAAVHAGYARRREELLRRGARIYELKPDAAEPEGAAGSLREGTVFGGGSAASLHAKTFSIDRKWAFVGSFNLDPRSLSLNTEMGLVIDDPQIADAISSTLDQRLPRVAYEVTLTDHSRGLEWVDRTEQGEVRYPTEPKTGFFKRFGVGILSLLPVEWLL